MEKIYLEKRELNRIEQILFVRSEYFYFLTKIRENTHAHALLLSRPSFAKREDTLC